MIGSIIGIIIILLAARILWGFGQLLWAYYEYMRGS